MLPRVATSFSRAARRSSAGNVLRGLPCRQRSLATVPRIAERGVWDSIIPRALRERKHRSQGVRPKASKEWNPATFFIVIFMIIGSNAINLIAVRTGAQTFSQKTEARISLLKDAIERLHRGEDVDVKKMLGTGDEKEEQGWEEAMQEIENAIKNSDKKEPELQENARAAEPEPHRSAGSTDTSSASQVEGGKPSSAEADRLGFY